MTFFFLGLLAFFVAIRDQLKGKEYAETYPENN